MPEVVSDIIVSPAVVWVAPYGEAVPADSVAAGIAWGGNWVKLGYTKSPLSCLYETDEVEIMVEQVLGPVKRQKTSEHLTLETNLAELYADGLAYAGGTVSATAAGAGQVGKEELDIGDEAALIEYAFGFEASYVDEDGATFPIRVFVWKATAKINGALEFAKADSTAIPLQVKALEDTTLSVGQRLFQLQKILEPAS